MPVCVLLANEEALGTPALNAGFARWRGVPVFDAAREARGAFGILGENLSPEEARACADAFQACGIATRELAAPTAPPLPAPVMVGAVESLDDAAGLAVTAAGGRKGVVRFAEIALIATAVIADSTVHVEETTQGPSLGARVARVGLTLTTGMSMGVGKTKKVEREVEERHDRFLCDLYLQGAGRRLRFDPMRLDYRFLGSEMAYGIAVNYRLFVKRLAESAPAAKRSRGAEILLAGKPSAQAGYDREADYDRECRWRCALAGITAPP